jgi:hypothetical protein
MNLLERYKQLRARSEAICQGLQAEDFVVQPVVDVSPPKWHLGHTTWFFETFVLVPNAAGYRVFNEQYNYVFNSYYESVGARVVRTDRGNLSRPSVADVMAYRSYVDAAMQPFLAVEGLFSEDLKAILALGFNHEEQHQELLITDIKYILGNNPCCPPIQQTIPNPRYPPLPESNGSASRRVFTKLVPRETGFVSTMNSVVIRCIWLLTRFGNSSSATASIWLL